MKVDNIKKRRRLLQVIRDIVSRCSNPNHKSYHHYGGRGIGVYTPWTTNRMAFLNYLMALDGSDDARNVVLRKDRDVGYVPGNLVFAAKGCWLHKKGVDDGECGGAA